MNNPDNYAYKLVCIDESALEYCVEEDLNRGTLEEIHKELDKRITKYNIGNTRWMLLPMAKQKI